MIYIYPVGGLGNILFQIAAIASIAKDNNVEPCLLMIDRIVRDLDKDDRLLTAHANEYRFIFDRFKQLPHINKPAMQYPFHYVPPVFKDEHTYIGFFQSEKYFGHNRDHIKHLFRPTEEIEKVVNNYSEYFGHIAIHVRRGDYLRYTHLHPVQSVEYYKKGIDCFPKDKKVLIFSDDMNWCRQQFVGDRFVYMNEKDYIEIYIMAKMKYHVISNSSFSWWGAWLAESELVVGPQKWFGSGITHNDNDVIPETWKKF
jgi:hypothetical protein